MTRVVTVPGTGDWIVLADWFGELRRVFGSASLFSCLRFAYPPSKEVPA